MATCADLGKVRRMLIWTGSETRRWLVGRLYGVTFAKHDAGSAGGGGER